MDELERAPSPEEPPVFLSVRDAATELELSVKRLYQLVREQNLETVKIHGCIHLSLRDIEQLRARSIRRPRRGPQYKASLPTASDDTRKAVKSSLARLLRPTGQDLFSKSRTGTIRLDSPSLHLRPAVVSYIRNWLGEGKDAISFAQIEQLAWEVANQDHSGEEVSQSSAPGSRPPAVLGWDDITLSTIRFLTLDIGIHLNQSILIFGREGTFKSRLAATLAVLLAGQYDAPVLYYAIGGTQAESATLLRDTVEVWKSQFEAGGKGDRFKHISIVPEPGASRNELPSVPYVQVLGASLAPDELLQDVLENVRQIPETAAVIIDSIGPLGALSREDVRELLLNVRTPARTVIVVAEESDEEEVKKTTEVCRWTCDLEIHLSCSMPEGERRGIGQRYFELLKSRVQPVIVGRHALEAHPDSSLYAYPSVDSFDLLDNVPSFRALEERIASRKPYSPGFVFPGGELDAFDDYIKSGWGEGGALCLDGPVRTHKEMISLNAAANAIASGRSVILVNLRPNILRIIKKRVDEHPCLRKTFTEHGAAIDYLPTEHLGQGATGKTPSLYVAPLSMLTSAEKLLWYLYRGISESYKEDRPNPVGLVIFMHFSELVVLPGFTESPSFTRMAQRLLSRLHVSMLACIDSNTWKRNLRFAGHPDLIPTLDFQVHLRPTKKDPDIAQVGPLSIRSIRSDDDTFRLTAFRTGSEN